MTSVSHCRRRVSEAVLDGRYGIDQSPYQDCFRLLSEWWQYTPEGAHSGGDDSQAYGFFLSGDAATRYGGIWDNKNLLRDMPTNENPFEWGAFPIPIISTMESAHATGKQTAAVFTAGHALFTLPAYNSGAKRDATADLLMYMSVPENIGALLAEDQGLVPNIKNVPLPPSLSGFRINDDATYWFVNSWGNTHITAEARDAWVRNWQLVLLGGMSTDEYTEVMQAELIKAAEDTLNI